MHKLTIAVKLALIQHTKKLPENRVTEIHAKIMAMGQVFVSVYVIGAHKPHEYVINKLDIKLFA